MVHSDDTAEVGIDVDGHVAVVFVGFTEEKCILSPEVPVVGRVFDLDVCINHHAVVENDLVLPVEDLAIDQGRQHFQYPFMMPRLCVLP